MGCGKLATPRMSSTDAPPPEGSALRLISKTDLVQHTTQYLVAYIVIVPLGANALMDIMPRIDFGPQGGLLFPRIYTSIPGMHDFFSLLYIAGASRYEEQVTFSVLTAYGYHQGGSSQLGN